MTALQKPDGGIRGIATGTVFRRLVAKTLARQFGTAVEAACAPFQFALSTRAGVDCVGHTVKAATEANQRMTVLSVDGIGAFDHVLRAAMLSKLKQVPGLHNLLLFVRQAHSSPSSYAWEDAERQRHSIGQHEGGEQGDPLMPLLFSLAIHDALEEVQAELEDGELLFAFLDDVYVVCLPNRVRTIFDLLGARLSRVAGIRLHDGKTRVWNKAGECPERVAELGPDVWSPQGVKILGTPVGSGDFVERMATERLAEEQKLWEALAWIPDLQCAWQVLLQCAGPRCHHFLRTVPPSQTGTYAVGHDRGMMQAMEKLLGGFTGESDQQVRARQIASLPMRLGGLGMRSAGRMSQAAYWASWADAHFMIHQRLPQLAQQFVTALSGLPLGEGCLGELQNAAISLDHQGFVNRPTWTELRLGKRPPEVDCTEPGEWSHGWQFHASSSSEHFFRKTVVLAQSCVADQAHLRSHSGPGSSDVLMGCPTGPEFQVKPGAFRTLVLERLRLPLSVTSAVCECGARLDLLGRHRAACPRSGRLRTRAVPTERTLARVCREAGASVRVNAKLRDMNVQIRADDERAIEVLASGLPIFHGAQLAVDITLRSPLTSGGLPRPEAAHVDGVVLLHRARGDKEAKYSELLQGNRCHLVVVGVETGGRWSSEAATFVDHLASGRVREVPSVLRRSAHLAFRRRWMRMIAVSCSRAFAASLV